ncbi:MAG: Spy/CpxP family protein refolding chaperone [Thermoanaerobaculia bacterium]
MSSRKPKRFITVLVLAGAAVFSLATVLAAEPGHGRRGAMGPMAERFAEHRFERLARYLELSEAQRAEAEALREQWLGDMHERFETTHASFEKIHEMAAAENPDATAIGELVIQMHREHEAMQAAHEGYRAELVKLLTPEQAEKLEAWEAASPLGEDFGPHRLRRGHHGAPFHSPDTD